MRRAVVFAYVAALRKWWLFLVIVAVWCLAIAWDAHNGRGIGGWPVP